MFFNNIDSKSLECKIFVELISHLYSLVPTDFKACSCSMVHHTNLLYTVVSCMWLSTASVLCHRPRWHRGSAASTTWGLRWTVACGRRCGRVPGTSAAMTTTTGTGVCSMSARTASLTSWLPWWCAAHECSTSVNGWCHHSYYSLT